jgi:hypothetical protein
MASPGEDNRDLVGLAIAAAMADTADQDVAIAHATREGACQRNRPENPHAAIGARVARRFMAGSLCLFSSSKTLPVNSTATKRELSGKPLMYELHASKSGRGRPYQV